MQYQKYLEELPEVVKNIIKEADVPSKLREVAKDYKIHLDKWIPLEEEVMLTLIGVKPPELLAQNISAVTGMDLMQAQSLTDDLAQKVFMPINEQLQDILQGGKKRAVETLKNSISDETPVIDYKDSQTKSSQRPYSPDDPYREPID